MSKSWYSIQNRADQQGTAIAKQAEVSIHDEIGSWGIRFQDFHRDLKALGPLDGITLSINSPGGEVFDGLAIYNVLSQSPAHITVRVEGIAASIASVIAMAGDDIQMPENAMIMVHNPWAIALGDSEEMRKMAEVLDKMRGSILSAYRDKTGIDDATLTAMMDEETWLTGPEAIEKGFADTLLKPVHMANAIAGFDTHHFAKMPRISASMNTEATSAATESSATEQAQSETTASQQSAESSTVESTTPGKTTETATEETTATEAAQASLWQRITAAFSGDTVPRAELTTAQASIVTLTSDLDAARARVTALESDLTEYTAIKAKLAQLESTRQTTAQQAAAVVAQHGFSPEKSQALPSPAAAGEPDLNAQFENASPVERGALLKKHGLSKLQAAWNSAHPPPSKAA